MALVQTVGGCYSLKVRRMLCGCVVMLMAVCSDFLAYCMFAFSCFRVPTGLSFTVHVMRCVLTIKGLSFASDTFLAGLAVSH